MSRDDNPLEIAHARLSRLERQFTNFIMIGDGVNVQGDLKFGYVIEGGRGAGGGGGEGSPSTLTGACCHTDGSCTMETAESCAALGGTYEGNNVVCSNVHCPPPVSYVCDSIGASLSKCGYSGCSESPKRYLSYTYHADWDCIGDGITTPSGCKASGDVTEVHVLDPLNNCSEDIATSCEGSAHGEGSSGTGCGSTTDDCTNSIEDGHCTCPDTDCEQPARCGNPAGDVWRSAFYQTIVVVCRRELSD